MSPRGFARGLAAVATAALLAVVAGAAPAHAGFVPALGSPFSFQPPVRSLAVADADRNGALDVAAGAPTLRRGLGTGFLGGATPIGPAGPSVDAVVAADLNLDGLTDYAAIVPDTPGDRLVRHIALAGGGYATDEPIGAEDGLGDAVDLAVATIDADGLPDLVALSDAPGAGVTVVHGADLDTAVFDSNVAQPTALATGDLDLDGRVDVVAAGQGAAVRVLANSGGGQLDPGAAQPTAGAQGPLRDVALADLDRDGHPDIVVADALARLRVLRSDREGGFLAGASNPTGLPAGPLALALADIDGDGNVDALTGGDGRVTVQLGDGAARFALDPSWTRTVGAPAGADIGAVAAADMNLDGQPDAVTANGDAGSVSVLLNDQTGVLTSSPAVVDFGALLPASGSRTGYVRLRSTRGALRITRLERNGSRLFAVSDLDCIGRVLQRGESCSVAVRFDAPRKAARHEALLSVDANAPAVVVALGATTRPPLIARQRLARKRVRPGQRLLLRYRLSEGALVRVLTERARPGRRVAGECVAAVRANRRLPRCTRWVQVGTVRSRVLGGPNKLKVATRAKPTGRGRKRRAGAPYPPGVYRLSLSASDRFANRSPERRLRFRVVAPPRRR